ncbi:MAG: hypothetical protein ACR2KL_13815 [Nocardioidaceae bacterium]
MRWDDLFADLEVEAAAAAEAARDAEIAERTRTELARVGLMDRLQAVVHRSVTLHVEQVGALSGTLLRVTGRWLLLEATTVEWLVSLSAVLGVSGLPARASSPERGSAVELASSWGAAWRVLARDRTQVQVVRRDGTTVRGVPQRVGADFVELLPPPAVDDSARRGGTMSELLPFAAVLAVRCPRERTG